jgi:predicted DNA-binding transcriptional regulator AlpA
MTTHTNFSFITTPFYHPTHMNVPQAHCPVLPQGEPGDHGNWSIPACRRVCRLKQIIGDPHAYPPVPAIIPVSKSTWWQGVKTGRFPAPVKFGPRITVWRAEDIRALIEGPGTERAEKR